MHTEFCRYAIDNEMKVAVGYFMVMYSGNATVEIWVYTTVHYYMVFSRAKWKFGNAHPHRRL